MNFVFISPQFPRTYWNFCDRLKKNGVNVLGIGDTAYDQLSEECRGSMNEYYRVDNMEDYDQVYRAVAFFAHKYGRIDWVESNNEYWLAQDARLRSDFNITSGVKAEEIGSWKSKSAMKPYYIAAGVPVARCHKVEGYDDCAAFLEEVGYPVIVKPDIGVGAADTYKLEKPEDLDWFFSSKPDVPYLMEEFITGDIRSYDVITDADCNPLFESMTCWPPSIADIVNRQEDLSYYTAAGIDEKLRALGRATVKSFNVRSRFVHLEFFHLTQPRKGLGEVGDYVGLEVNMRPAGGYTPDMMDFAHATDVYQIWADMVAFNERRLPDRNEDHCCVYAGRRDIRQYKHSHEEVMARYGSQIVMAERIPDILSGAMGNQMYTMHAADENEVAEIVRFVQEKA